MVTLRNIIHSAVAMMVCFGSLAGMYALLGAPIVAAAQVLIYLSPFHRQVWAAALVALVVVGLIGWAVTATDWGNATVVVPIVIDSMAQALFTDYALPFEILSLLLLAAIIGAIYLARRPEDDERAN